MGRTPRQLRVIDLSLSDSEMLPEPRKLMRVQSQESLCSVLIRMHTERESMAEVVDVFGRVIGIVTEYELSEMLNVNYGAPRA